MNNVICIEVCAMCGKVGKLEDMVEVTDIETGEIEDQHQSCYEGSFDDYLPDFLSDFGNFEPEDDPA